MSTTPFFFVVAALSMAVFGYALAHLPMPDDYRDALEDLHFRSVYALAFTATCATILRILESSIRRKR